MGCVFTTPVLQYADGPAFSFLAVLCSARPLHPTDSRVPGHAALHPLWNCYGTWISLDLAQDFL